MTARPHSPNGIWQRLGCTVERDARGARTIIRPDGSTVEVSRHDGKDRYSAELRALELAALVSLPSMSRQSVTNEGLHE